MFRACPRLYSVQLLSKRRCVVKHVNVTAAAAAAAEEDSICGRLNPPQLHMVCYIGAKRSKSLAVLVRHQQQGRPGVEAAPIDKRCLRPPADLQAVAIIACARADIKPHSVQQVAVARLYCRCMATHIAHVIIRLQYCDVVAGLCQASGNAQTAHARAHNNNVGGRLGVLCVCMWHPSCQAAIALLVGASNTRQACCASSFQRSWQYVHAEYLPHL